RRLSARPADTKPSRNVIPHNPTKDALWINSGMPTSAVAGVATEPPPLLNDSRKSKLVQRAAKASIPAIGARFRATKRAPSTGTAKKNDGMLRERTITESGST